MFHPPAEAMVSMEVWAAGCGRQPALQGSGRGPCRAAVPDRGRSGPFGSGRTSMLQALYQHCAQNQTYWLEQIRAVTGDAPVDLATADSIFLSQFEPGQALQLSMAFACPSIHQSRPPTACGTR